MKPMAMSRNEELVWQLLEKTRTPMSAYDILDMLRGDGMRAPLQVYRALNKLRERGAVHRIDSLNAFVACSLHDCETHEMSIFILCTKCDTASEFTDKRVTSALDAVCNERGFGRTRKVVEITGQCEKCRSDH